MLVSRDVFNLCKIKALLFIESVICSVMHCYGRGNGVSLEKQCSILRADNVSPGCQGVNPSSTTCLFSKLFQLLRASVFYICVLDSTL